MMDTKTDMKSTCTDDIIRAFPTRKPHGAYLMSKQTKQPKQDANADRYIAIARACLRAINDTAAEKGTREEKIQAVYEAIDEAFQQEFADYHQATAVMASVLERIASGQLSGEEAANLAGKTLEQQPQRMRQSVIH